MPVSTTDPNYTIETIGTVAFVETSAFVPADRMQKLCKEMTEIYTKNSSYLKEFKEVFQNCISAKIRKLVFRGL